MWNYLSSQPDLPSNVTDKDLLAIDKKLFTAAVLRELRKQLQGDCDCELRPLHPELQAEGYQEVKDRPSAMLQTLSRQVEAFRDKLQSNTASRKDFVKNAVAFWFHSLYLCKLFRSARDNAASFPVDFDELAFDEGEPCGEANQRRFDALLEHDKTALAILGPQWHSSFKRARTTKNKPVL